MNNQPVTSEKSLASGEDAVLLRIYIGDGDKHGHLPLYEAIVLKAREMHLAGATVLRSAMGYGSTSKLHTAKILQLSTDLPIVIEVVDLKERIDLFLAVLDTMMQGGLVTQEPVRVLHYQPHKNKENKGPA
jgi:PII-like signaling protein